MTRRIIAFAGKAGCVDKETEYLSEAGWKKVSEYSGEKIAVYCEDGFIKYEYPLNYLKYPATTWYNFKSKYGLSLKLSGEHNVYYITSKNNLYHSKAEYIYNKIKNNKNHSFSGKLISTIDINNDYEAPYSDDLMRLIVAVQADGSRVKNSTSTCRFSINVKKDRKKNRIEYLLNSCNVHYTKTVAKDSSSNAGYCTYRFDLPEGTKEFPDNWFTLSKRQLAIIAEEAVLWDGRINKRGNYEYYSNNKKNVDLIQFAFMVTKGVRTSISIDERYLKNDTHYKTPNYKVYTTFKKYIGMNGNRHKLDGCSTTSSAPSKDEYKYCFTTSTGMWLMRRDNNIVVTGNSGKDYRCQQLEKQGNFKRMAFADTLRDIAFSSLGIPFNEGMKIYEWMKANKCITLTFEDNATYSLDFRKFLEYMGTEGIRKYDKDFWARALVNRIDGLPEDVNVCVSDLRFHNEYKFLKEYADSHDCEFEFIFCDYHSDRYEENNRHASARLAAFLKEVGYEDGDHIKDEDMQHYISALEELSAV